MIYRHTATHTWIPWNEADASQGTSRPTTHMKGLLSKLLILSNYEG